MSNYPPPNTGYYPPQQQQPYYGAQPQPQYVPLQQQPAWGLQQAPPQQQQPNHFAPQGQPMPPPTYDGSINPDSGLPSKFNPKPKYNDLWAAILFIIQLAGFIVLSYFSITNALKYNKGPSGGSKALGSLFSTGGLITLCISVGVGAAFSVVYFCLTVAFPTFLIKATLLLSIILYLAVAAYYLYLRMWVVGAIALIFGVLYAFMWFAWKSRIPFASIMLRTVTSVSRDYPAVYAVSFLGLVTQIAYSIYFLLVFAGTYDFYFTSGTSGSGNNKSALFYVLVVFAVFSFYWTSQVLSNIVHTTVCGVYATYYFMAGSPQGMTKSPTVESFKRSVTTSFGSICFGSLVIAIIQTLRFIANMARGDGDGMMAFVACCIDCLLACLQGIAEFINKYAFAQVAIYGKGYMQAARDTWTIILDRGIEQIINDNLIGNVWGMAALFSGFLSGLATYLYLHFANPAFNAQGQLTIALVIVGFVMGLQICFTVGTVIDSGVVTTFVCLAEDPAALARTKPELFAQIQATWPEVVQGIRY